MHHRDTGSSTADSSGENSAVGSSRITSETCATNSPDSSTSAEILTALTDTDWRIDLGESAEQPCFHSGILRISSIYFQYYTGKGAFVWIVGSSTNGYEFERMVQTSPSIPPIHPVHVEARCSGTSGPSIVIFQRTDSARSGRAMTDREKHISM